MADLISNVMFGYYNYRSKSNAYYLIPALKNMIISKFPYKYFKEPIMSHVSKEIDTIDIL